MCVALTLIEPCPPAGSGLMSLLRYWSPDTAASLGGAPLTVCVSMCVCVCVCVYVCLYSVAWQPKFQRPISLSTSGFGDCKVARVGRPATEYKLVVRPWESGIRPCISCHFPTV